MADLLVGYCLDVQPREQILIRSSSEAQALLLELQRAVLDRGAWPHLRVDLPGQDRGFFEHAGDAQLDEVPSLAMAEAQQCERRVSIQAPQTLGALAGIDPARTTRWMRARRPLQEAAMQGVWCVTLWPTAALADEAGMALDDYAAFVARAMFLDRDDPIAAWGELHDFQDGLISRLRTADRIRLEADGTDLELSVAGRTWINSDGRRNMPSGEVFTGPVEDSANGTVRFSVKSSPPGVDVDGVTLTFRDGLVIEAHAEVGDEHLQSALETDGGARRLGEIGIGTNFGIDRPTGTILFDEKIGGTVHLALGRSYPETGGVNDSALHWDLICDLRTGGRLSADGEVVQESGTFAA